MRLSRKCNVSIFEKIKWIVVLSVGTGVAEAAAQDAPAPGPPAPAAAIPTAPQTANQSSPHVTGMRTPDSGSIDAALKANDNLQVQQALDSAIAMLADPKTSQSSAEKVPSWLHELVVQRRFDDLEDFALAAINARPADLRLIEACQQSRIRAKLLQNKPQEALSLAKSLYDVCAMPDTSRAIDTIAECLYDISDSGGEAGDTGKSAGGGTAANTGGSDPAGAVKKFKLEQIHGAAATEPSAADANMLSDVRLDPSQYSAGLQKVDFDENGWESSMGRGNLLLLSGQAKEAHKVFEKAYALASDNNLAAATEAVARAMRAEDGTVGRANAWILSLRPPEQAAQ